MAYENHIYVSMYFSKFKKYINFILKIYKNLKWYFILFKYKKNKTLK